MQCTSVFMCFTIKVLLMAGLSFPINCTEKPETRVSVNYLQSSSTYRTLL